MLEYYFFKLLKKLRLKGSRSSKIADSSKVESGTSFISSEMSDYSFCGYNCDIIHARIGKFTSIANNVKIGGGMHPIKWVSTSPVFYEGRDSVTYKFSSHVRDEIKTTIIGNDVWIGEGVIIKQGVKIGDGAVVGMGSVVTKDVLPYTIVGGVPAKLIKNRFDSNQIVELMKVKWWDLDTSKLHKLSPFVTDVDEFLSRLKEL